MAKSITDIAGRNYGEAKYTEGEAASDLTPGEGVVLSGTNADGEPQYDTPSSVEPTGPQSRFVEVPSTPPQEDDSDTDPIDQTVSSGTLVETRVYDSGESVQNAFLAAGADLGTSSEANVGVGDRLAFNDDGALKEATTAGAEVAVAQEAIDNSTASAGDRVRIDVEVL